MASTTTCCGTTTTSCDDRVRPAPALLSAADHHARRSDAHAGLLPRRACGGTTASCTAGASRAARSCARCPPPTARRPLLPWTVQVRKGYAIGPYGDEIIVDCDRTVDLRTSGVAGVTGDACVERSIRGAATSTTRTSRARCLSRSTSRNDDATRARPAASAAAATIRAANTRAGATATRSAC